MTNQDEPPFIGMWSFGTSQEQGVKPENPQDAVQFFVPKPHFKWVPFRLSARNALIIYKQDYARMAFQYRTWLASQTAAAKDELTRLMDTLPVEARRDVERIAKHLKRTDNLHEIQALRSQFLQELEPETLLQLGQQVARGMEVAA